MQQVDAVSNLLLSTCCMFVQQVAQTCNKSTECATSRQQQVAVDSNKSTAASCMSGRGLIQNASARLVVHVNIIEAQVTLLTLNSATLNNLMLY